MKLYLLRHAKTEQAAPGGRDIDRNLLPKGRNQAALLAQHLPDLTHTDIHCSSSTRTRQTLDELAVTCQFASIFFTEDLYLATANQLLHYLNQLPGTRNVLLLGHNEGISELAMLLTGQAIHMQTAAFVELDVEVGDWAHLSCETARIIGQYRPEVD